MDNVIRSDQDPKDIPLLILVVDLERKQKEKEKELISFIKEQGTKFSHIYAAWQTVSNPRTGEQERAKVYEELDELLDNHVKDYTSGIDQYHKLTSRIEELSKEKIKRLTEYQIPLNATHTEVREALRRYPEEGDY